ncbi:MAG: YlqD family protein [Thermincolia bacterium]
MNSITIKRPVTVKVKVTEDFKNRAAAELREAVRKIELELQHLDFKEKRMLIELEKQNPQGIPAAKQHVEQQRNKGLENRAAHMTRIKEMAKLPIGSEVVQGTLDTITELKAGDTWSDIYTIEVIVCDNKVIEIRQLKAGDFSDGEFNNHREDS